MVGFDPDPGPTRVPEDPGAPMMIVGGGASLMHPAIASKLASMRTLSNDLPRASGRRQIDLPALYG